MRRQIAPAVRVLLVLTVLTGLAYPLAVTGVAAALFADAADGSLVEVDHGVVGSSLIGQAFSGAGYFHTRPSAAGPGASGTPVEDSIDPTDLSFAVSGASSQGPTNPELLDAIAERAASYRRVNGIDADVTIPVDAVTASASGVDPHISLANARLQAPRVAAERGVPLAAVLRLVDEHTDQRSLGFLGEDGVNVLQLNLAVDRMG